MFDKLEDLVARLDELQNELSDPNVASNAERFRNLMKEQANLAPIVEKYQEYRKRSRRSRIAYPCWRAKATRRCVRC